MSMRLRYEDGGKLNVMLDNMINACDETGQSIQHRLAKVVKARIVGNLNRLRSKTQEEDYKHMADDVHINVAKNKYGDKVLKVQGGKRTGTLWHIVNDGSYNMLVGKRNRATHFIDDALKDAESEIDNIIDDELQKAGF